MRLFSSSLATALLLSVSATALAADPVDIVIHDVTVIDPEHGTVTPSRDVVIDGGRIVAVLDAGRAPAADKVVEANGKFLIPGLMDMHSHSSFRPVHTATLKLMAANGVTGVREMGSDCIEPGGIAMCIDEMRQAQGRIDASEMVGPRILELSTLKIVSERSEEPDAAEILYRPVTAEEARATVAGLAERHPDILKVGDQLHPDAFRALTAAAKERGLKFGGHIPPMFSVADVAAMGMTSIEHARDLPLDCSAFGKPYRAQVMAKIMGEDVPRPNRREIPGKARDTFDEATCKAQIAAMVEHGTYYVPTHLTREMDYRAGEEAYRGDPRLAYISRFQQRRWNGDLNRTAEAPPEMVKDLADFFQLGLKTTKMAHDAGVKIMVGTDANDTMVFPGFSLHDELRHLVAAGLTPMAALQAATSVPADYLGRSADFGGVSEGKLADLVLLDDDPMLDIANTTHIAAVIQAGRLRDRAALDGLLEDVKKWVAKADEKAKSGE